VKYGINLIGSWQSAVELCCIVANSSAHIAKVKVGVHIWDGLTTGQKFLFMYLFLCCLLNDAASSSDQIASSERMINELWIRKKYVTTYDILAGLRKTTKTRSQDCLSPGRDLNPEPPEYESKLLTTRPWRWMREFCFVLGDSMSRRGRSQLNRGPSLGGAWYVSHTGMQYSC
jgi:hypothetical protein